MNDLLQNIHLAAPELVILLTACLALLGDLFFRQRMPSISWGIASLGLLVAGAFCILYMDDDVAFLFNGLFVSDALACIMKLFICITVLFSLFYARRYIRDREMSFGDIHVLALFSTLGMMILVSASHLLIIYLGLELMSLPLYAMTAMRRDSGEASEAAMKYFAMGAVASGMLLYGMSFLYGATGVLSLQTLPMAVVAHGSTSNLMITFGLVFMVTGVAFKLAAVPFHMWAPDVYQGAPSNATLFISTAPKIAALAMLLRLVIFALPSLSAQWQQLLWVMSVLSVGVGNVLAIAQDNVKRLLAYSAISHMGYALFGILAGTAAGLSASLYYMLVYTLMSAAAFGFLVILSQKGRDIEWVSDLRGLSKTAPWFALMFMIVLFSMAGVPPTVGFFTKLLVLKALVSTGHAGLAVFGLVFAVIGAFYYLRLIKVMYFDAPADWSPAPVPKGTAMVFSANCLLLLYWGIIPGALIAACIRVFAM